jgi:hypothetical protein
MVRSDRAPNGGEPERVRRGARGHLRAQRGCLAQAGQHAARHQRIDLDPEDQPIELALLVVPRDGQRPCSARSAAAKAIPSFKATAR